MIASAGTHMHEYNTRAGKDGRIYEYLHGQRVTKICLSHLKLRKLPKRKEAKKECRVRTISNRLDLNPSETV